MSGEVCWLVLNILTKPAVLLAQERMYEWHWEMHPMWWWGWGMMAMMFLFWVVVYRRSRRCHSLAPW